jgi:valyl-tRNA synthetase
MELPKAYIPKEYEDKIYEKWEASGYFNPDNLKTDKNAPSFVISMPPPNATGILHVGHTLGIAIQDIMTRYHRMKGDRTLMLPGTDHAAIATQNVVEKLLKKEGSSRHKLGREKFLQRTNKYVKENKHIINNQTRKMGASADWSREAYTMSDKLNKVVAMQFKKMYDEGLIYRGDRIVNWCPRCHSTLADDEVEYRQQKGKFWTFKYARDFPILIATTRPETKLGDTAVAVNPNDKRYKKYIGQEFKIDFVGVPLKIKIIGDKEVDPAFGTGAVGVTPAHSMVDWQMAEQNSLKIKKVIGQDGKILGGFGKYSGLNVKEAREKIVDSLKKDGLIEKEEEIENNISLCYRCGTEIEPLPSLQWFIAVDKKFKIKNPNLIKNFGKDKTSLKEISLWAVKSGKIKIIPDYFDKTYFHWMKNLRDWCISRQIWFGHRIPVWYKTGIGSSMEAVSFKSEVLFKKLGLTDEKAFEKFTIELENKGSFKDKNIQWGPVQNGVIPLYIGYVNLLKQKEMITDEWLEQNRLRKPSRQAQMHIGENPPEEIGWYQDPDTLDTWFSSALWTWSTLLNRKNYKQYKTLEQWTKNSPDLEKFHPTSVMETMHDILFFWVARMIMMTLYTLGEVPFRVVYLHGMIADKYGRKMSKSYPETIIEPVAVAEKYGTDALRLSMLVDNSAGNKLNLSEQKIAGYRNFANKLWNIGRFIQLSKVRGQKSEVKPMTLADRWIESRMNNLIKEITKDLEKFRFGLAAEKLYTFSWHELADWYVEIAKIQNDQNTYSILNSVYLRLLKLLHPFTPFVTEKIWEYFDSHTLLMTEKWPDVNDKKIDMQAEQNFALIQQLITALRAWRKENKIQPKEVIKIKIAGADKLVVQQKEIISKLAKVELESVKKLVDKDFEVGNLRIKLG